MAAAALSKGPGEGFHSHQGAERGLCWFYGGVELLEQYKDTGAQGRIKANGLQLPAFLQGQLGAIKGTKSEESLDTHTELSLPRPAGLAVPSSSCTYGRDGKDS